MRRIPTNLSLYYIINLGYYFISCACNYPGSVVAFSKILDLDLRDNTCTSIATSLILSSEIPKDNAETVRYLQATYTIIFSLKFVMLGIATGL